MLCVHGHIYHLHSVIVTDIRVTATFGVMNHTCLHPCVDFFRSVLYLELQSADLDFQSELELKELHYCCYHESMNLYLRDKHENYILDQDVYNTLSLSVLKWHSSTTCLKQW